MFGKKFRERSSLTILGSCLLNGYTFHNLSHQWRHGHMATSAVSSDYFFIFIFFSRYSILTFFSQFFFTSRFSCYYRFIKIQRSIFQRYPRTLYLEPRFYFGERGRYGASCRVFVFFLLYKKCEC